MGQWLIADVSFLDLPSPGGSGACTWGSILQQAFMDMIRTRHRVHAAGRECARC
jgi:hypothetical protein